MPISVTKSAAGGRVCSAGKRPEMNMRSFAQRTKTLENRSWLELEEEEWLGNLDSNQD